MGFFFREHIPVFEKRLQQVNVEAVSGSAYCRQYLTYILAHHHYFLDMYAHLLDHCMEGCQKNPAEVSLLDYGAGNGLLGIFAKSAGIGKVFLCDMDPVFVEGSRQLAQQLGLHPEAYIPGDIHDASHQLGTVAPDMICGTDVIEHIYDLDDFFSKISQWNPRMLTGFTTAANIYHPVKRKRIMALQRKDEFIGNVPADSILSGEAHAPYRLIRKQIIDALDTGLPEPEIATLVTATRGLRKEDIETAVRQYILHQTLPSAPAHPTNTCHPLTGSWTERLLTKEAYQSIYWKYGFDLRIYKGFYDTHKASLLSSLFSQILNAGIRVAGLRLAPYLVLVGNSTVINEI